MVPAIGVCDGIAMGHIGMKYSLASRELIADSVECMMNGHSFDAMVLIPDCDKITPGMLMASMRLNIPTIFVSGGPMEAGELDGRHLDLIDAMIDSADDSCCFHISTSPCSVDFHMAYCLSKKWIYTR